MPCPKDRILLLKYKDKQEGISFAQSIIQFIMLNFDPCLKQTQYFNFTSAESSQSLSNSQNTQNQRSFPLQLRKTCSLKWDWQDFENRTMQWFFFKNIKPGNPQVINQRLNQQKRMACILNHYSQNKESRLAARKKIRKLTISF